jgi:histidinol-phosphate aminotransferase
MSKPDLSHLRPDVRALQAYHVQAVPPGLIKLDAMENPFVLSQELQAELGKRLQAVEINRYPGPRTEELQKALAEFIDLPRDHALMLGNGSDELIGLLTLAMARPGAKVLSPEPAFVMYKNFALQMGLEFVGVSLKDDFSLDLVGMKEAIELHRPSVVYLAYPNNPSANAWSESDIAEVIEWVSAYKGVVVMDEAYQPFAAKTWLTHMRENPEQNAQVILMRTLSKFGLAGVRIGYLVAQSAWVEELNKLRPPYNVSVLNAECALFALEHQEVYKAQAQTIMQEREKLFHDLAAIEGLTPYPSSANMMLVRVGAQDKGADELHAQTDAWFKSLQAHGILVKNVSKMHPLLAGCLRLTVGAPKENQAMVQAFSQIAQSM